MKANQDMSRFCDLIALFFISTEKYLRNGICFRCFSSSNELKAQLSSINRLPLADGEFESNAGSRCANLKMSSVSLPSYNTGSGFDRYSIGG